MSDKKYKKKSEKQTQMQKFGQFQFAVKGITCIVCISYEAMAKEYIFFTIKECQATGTSDTSTEL